MVTDGDANGYGDRRGVPMVLAVVVMVIVNGCSSNNCRYNNVITTGVKSPLSQH